MPEAGLLLDYYAFSHTPGSADARGVFCAVEVKVVHAAKRLRVHGCRRRATRDQLQGRHLLARWAHSMLASLGNDERHLRTI